MKLLALWHSVHFHRTFWALSDQAIVSLSMLVCQILLARHLPAAQYGTFALLFGGGLTLQLVNATLLFYPMSVRLVVARREEHKHLFASSLILIGLLSVTLGTVLASALLAFGRSELVIPSLAWFLLWQTQEGIRRGLLAELRPGAVIPGDSVTYVGQAICLAGLAIAGRLSITSALIAIALMSLLGAIVHLSRLRAPFATPLPLRRVLADYLEIGGWRALANGMFMTIRLQLLGWALAISSGPAATAACQAALNLMNASNPVMIGLGNIVPQAAAEGSGAGLGHAWRTVLRYASLGVPLILGYSVVVLAFPHLALRLLYGAASQYTGLSLAVRLLITSNLVGITTDFIVWFLQGIRMIQYAVGINLAGALAMLIFAFPLVELHGLTGGCVAMIGANCMRLIFARRLLTRMIAREPANPAPFGSGYPAARSADDHVTP